MLRILSLSLVLFSTLFFSAFASNEPSATELNAREPVNSTNANQGNRAGLLDRFREGAEDLIGGGAYFTRSAGTGDGAISNTLVRVARDIKNVGILIAIVMMIVAALVLIFSEAKEDDLKKWRSAIIYGGVGIIIMQTAYAAFNTFYLRDTLNVINGGLAVAMLENLIYPFVRILLFLASFLFVGMAFYAFYLLATAAGDEEQEKKGRQTIISAIAGYFLIKFPQYIVQTIYGDVECDDFFSTCSAGLPNLPEAARITSTIINYVNGFVAVITLLLFIWAGWLTFSSRGDEEKVKKAKSIFIYATIGMFVIVASHAFFKFFIIR